MNVMNMRANDLKKAALIIKDPEVIHLLSSFIKSEILRLLGMRPMTETQLSKVLGLTKAAVGYHLHSLKDVGLIQIDRYETEEHGISKYYFAVATLFVVDPDHVPENLRRYFLETQIMRLEGMLSVFKLYERISEVSSETLEELAKAMLRQLKVVGQRHAKDVGEYKDAESLRVRIYAEALGNLIVKKEWHNLFPDETIMGRNRE